MTTQAQTKPFSFVLKFILWLLGLGILVALAIPIYFFFFFNPNDFKPQINAYIHNLTGLPLEMSGPIHMTYFPNIGLSIDDVGLKQPESMGEGSFVKVKNLTLSIPVRELLERHLRVESLTINGLEMTIIKDKSGRTNLDVYTNQIKDKQNQQPAKPASSETQSSERKKLTFDLVDIKLRDSTITYIDQAKQEKTVLSKLDVISAGKHNDHTYPFKLHYGLVQEKAKQKQIESHGTIEGNWLSQEKRIDLKGSGNYQLDKQLPYNTGTYVLQGVVTKKQFSIEHVLLNTQDTRIEGTGTIPFEAKEPIRLKLASPHLKLKDHTLDQVHVELRIEPNQVLIESLRGELYQGHLNLKATIKKSEPIYTQGTLKQVDVPSLLRGLKQQPRIEGLADIDFNLALDNNSHGVIKAKLMQGVLKGVDVKYYIAQAQALLKKTQNTTTDTQQTPFGSLSATLNWHDNTIDTADLLLDSPDVQAKGEGSIYLGSQTLEFKITALRKKDSKVRDQDIPLALRIKGPLSHPKVSPDMDVYLKMMLKEEVQHQIEKHLKKDNGDGTQAKPEEVLRDKIEDEIEKGIKKLFKKKKGE